MKYAVTLIDKAGKSAGSFYKLAALTGLSESNISSMRAGRRPVPLDIVPVIAEMAGVDVDEAIHQVMIEQTKDPERRGRLVEILGKAVAAGVAGMLVFSYSSDSISATRQITKSDISLQLYTSWNVRSLRFALGLWAAISSKLPVRRSVSSWMKTCFSGGDYLPLGA